MDLVLDMCNTSSIHWCGISGRQLGKLHPSSSLCLALTLLSSVQGLQVGPWQNRQSLGAGEPRVVCDSRIFSKLRPLCFSQQSVSGLRLTDTFLKRTYEYDDIAQVCVVSSAIKVES